ncbi:MAG TPA: hypothetical protein VIL85_07170 [Thermomicrobiales bacterium]|jgi:hypothetical protein
MAEIEEEHAPKPPVPRPSSIAALAGIGRGVTIPFSPSQAREIAYEERWRAKQTRSHGDQDLDEEFGKTVRNNN